jgi:hypothetical protein
MDSVLGAAAFSDYDYILSQKGNIQVRPAVRRYFQVVHAVQLVRNVQWGVFCLLLTLAIEFEITFLFPNGRHMTALATIFLACILFVVAFGFMQCMWLAAGDPSDVFQTQDEEIGLLRNAVAAAARALPNDSIQEKNIKLGALFTVGPGSATSSDDESGASALPLARINSAPPQSLLPSGYSPVAAGTMRAGLKFAPLKRQ